MLSVKRPRPFASLFALGLIGVMAIAARADITITLTNSFIQEYQDRATIDADYTVDKAHKKPNPADKDGDMHVAGRSDDIGLATVAEIMNAASEHGAVDAVHAVEGTPTKIKVSGAWRLWCEHGGTDDQDQTHPPTAKFDTTNPPHVFEIHPITKIGQISLLDSLQPIAGYSPKEAHDAFQAYENLRCKFVPGESTTKVITSMGGYNYVKFELQLNEPGNSHAIPDGHTVFCRVRDLDGELIIQKRRMVFVKDSEPERELLKRKKDDRMQVLGIPRIDLAEVAWRAAHYNDPLWKDKDVLNWSLPYEIIVVGMYDESQSDDEH